MNERLKEFMQLEALTSVKFAEIMDVQPSSISHLLSGRNYPNYDFISKILLRFPTLNPDWIINGTGDIYRSDQPDVTNVDEEREPETNLIVTNVNPTQWEEIPRNTESDNNKHTLESAHVTDVYSQDPETISSSMSVPIPSVTTVTEASKVIEQNEQEIDNINHKSKVAKIESGIDQIVIFYSDGTFKEYTKR